MNELNEQQILDKLFSAGEEDNTPKKTVTVERVGLPILLSGLREDRLERLEKRFTTTKRVRGEEKKELDTARYNRAIIAEATKAIGGNPNVRFDHPQLLSKYKASGPEAVIKKIFLAGEIVQLADVVLELSGYYDQADEADEIKNFSPDED